MMYIIIFERMVTDNVKYQALNAIVKFTKYQVDKNSFFIWILI